MRATLIEPLEARSQQVNPDVGPVGRSVVDEEAPIKARGRVNTSTGRPKREAEAVAEAGVLEARVRIGSKTGNSVRDADEEPIKRDIGFPEGGSTSDSSDSGGSTGIKFNSPGGHRRDADADTGSVAIPKEALAERGRLVLLDPTDDLVERERGSNWGGSKRGLTPSPGGSYRREAEPIRISGSRGSHRREAEPIRIGGGHRREAEPIRIGGGHRREAEPIRISGSRGSHRREAEPIRISGSRGGHRREAKTVDQSMKNAGGGPKRRDAAAQPNRIGGGISGGRRDADAKAIEARQRMSSSTGRGRRDAIPGFVRPGGGTRPRDVTAETVEARTRLRGNSHRV
ncbi:uncharacterized protein J4E84_010571 [Alternaria hordeiaustralica]|uniref:uncharacterized protein n=1 Tax=Alternaria hordeiaustralica TaxID=1187925 RepID=UPI0020C4B50F|nr:uncharacterized protein J4E84_010571 [Alternaria hordeiaustralica]KAI4674333.1 hypothetical protein J4E84_010571 [Alternaria hordeiaustralica]